MGRVVFIVACTALLATACTQEGGQEMTELRQQVQMLEERVAQLEGDMTVAKEDLELVSTGFNSLLTGYADASGNYGPGAERNLSREEGPEVPENYQSTDGSVGGAIYNALADSVAWIAWELGEAVGEAEAGDTATIADPDGN